MKIGVPKEIKTNENRIALVPAGAEALVARGPLRARSRRAPAIGSGFADERLHGGRREDRARRRDGLARQPT